MSKKATIAWESWNAIVDEILNEDPVSILEAQLTEEEIEMQAGISLYNDHPIVMLKNSAEFLVNDPNIDDLAERFEAGLEKYITSKLLGAKNITEGKRRVKIHVRR